MPHSSARRGRRQLDAYKLILHRTSSPVATGEHSNLITVTIKWVWWRVGILIWRRAICIGRWERIVIIPNSSVGGFSFVILGTCWNKMACGSAITTTVVFFTKLSHDAFFSVFGYFLWCIHPSAHLLNAISLHLLERFIPFPRFVISRYTWCDSWNLLWYAPFCCAGYIAGRMLSDAFVDIRGLSHVEHAIRISKHIDATSGSRLIFCWFGAVSMRWMR